MSKNLEDILNDPDRMEKFFDKVAIEMEKDLIDFGKYETFIFCISTSV